MLSICSVLLCCIFLCFSQIYKFQINTINIMLCICVYLAQQLSSSILLKSYWFDILLRKYCTYSKRKKKYKTKNVCGCYYSEGNSNTVNFPLCKFVLCCYIVVIFLFIEYNNTKQHIVETHIQHYTIYEDIFYFIHFIQLLCILDK